MHDLVGDGPYRSSCVAEAIRVDGADMLAGPEATGAIHRLTVPGVLLWADRGLLDQTPGAYSAESTAGLPVAVGPRAGHQPLLDRGWPGRRQDRGRAHPARGHGLPRLGVDAEGDHRAHPGGPAPECHASRVSIVWIWP